MTSPDFEHYRHEAVHALMDLNEEAENGFRLAEWPRWSYDLEAASLVFLRDNVPRVIAAIQVAGSIDAAGTTWRWGWADPGIPRKAVERMDEVRAFVQREAIAELAGETCPATEDTGWELTAIAGRILGARGAFRCARPGGGVLYLVYTAIHFAPDAQAAVECAMHGRGLPTYLCEHLAADAAQPWYSEEASPANPWPDAWCRLCDALYMEEGEWNERNGPRLRVKVLCHRCYESKRKLAVPA